MKRTAFFSMTLAALFGAAVIGCDDTVAEKKEVDVKSDGTVVTDKEKVTEKADGTIVHEKSKDVDKPADNDVDDDEGAKIKVDVDKE